MGNMRGLIERLTEPSSYAAIAGILAILGINVDESLWRHVVEASSALAFVAAYFIPEKRNREG